jgi:hypothetical protein
MPDAGNDPLLALLRLRADLRREIEQFRRIIDRADSAIRRFVETARRLESEHSVHPSSTRMDSRRN